MTRTPIVPRKDQISELTRGLELPFNPLQKIHLTIVTELLAQAWRELSLDHRETIAQGNEAEINALMAARLNGLLESDIMWHQLVRNVTRGTESISYDGSHLEKRPDLSIHLTNRSASFPLVVECKIVDINSGRTIKLYCEKGLVRYINGEYIVGRRQKLSCLLMCITIRQSSSSFIPFLIESENVAPPPYRVVSLPKSVPHATADLACSLHKRNFIYQHNHRQNLPGPISIWHMWVSLDLRRT